MIFTLLAATHAFEVQEDVLRIPMRVETESLSTEQVMLEATLYRAAGKGPFKLLVMNHGATGGADPSPRWRPAEQARWFVKHGYAVVVPMRRGYARSEGGWAEGFGTCASADYFGAALESAKDIAATIDFMARVPGIDARQVVLVGHSAGAMGAVALASLHTHPIALVLNFAGGRGSFTGDDGLSRYNCSEEALIRAWSVLGQTTRVPTLWLYAENDLYFPPALARRMFDAFQTSSHHAKFVTLPSFEFDGHAVFWKPAGMSMWTSAVEVALGRIHSSHRAQRK